MVVRQCANRTQKQIQARQQQGGVSCATIYNFTSVFVVVHRPFLTYCVDNKGRALSAFDNHTQRRRTIVSSPLVLTIIS